MGNKGSKSGNDGNRNVLYIPPPRICKYCKGSFPTKKALKNHRKKCKSKPKRSPSFSSKNRYR